MKFVGVSTTMSLGHLILLAALAFANVSDSESASVGEYMNNAKDYLVGLVRDGILSRSTVATFFSETMSNIKERFNEAKKSGELDGKDENEVSAYYYKLVIEEIRNLKQKIAADSPAEQEDESALDKFISSCTNCARSVKKNRVRQFDMMDMEMDMDDEDEDDEERELMNELDNLEDLTKKETEMGWGLTPENKAALQSRTLQVLGELVQNELKTLAMIIITGYLGGPAVGAMGPAVAAAKVSVKFKLIEFFMHSVMDMFAGLLGQKISPQMESSLQTAKQEAAEASIGQ